MTEIREALTASFDKAEPAEAAPAPEAGPPIEAVGTDETPTPGEVPSEAAPSASATAPAKDPKTGKFVPRGTAPVTPAPKAVVTPLAAPSTCAPPSESAAPPEAQKPATLATKAPQSWRPEAREKWGTLPPEVQNEAIRLDREVRQTLQESAEAKKSWSAFQQTVGPYEALIRAEGGEPLKAVGSLLQTAAALRTAPPAHKARLVANIIQQYGVPVETLAEVLTGQAATAPAQGATQAPALDPEALLQQAEQRVFQRIQQQRAQSVEAKARADTEAFINSGEAEFLEDVRPLMANLLDAAGRSGIALTLKDAYDRACLLSPDVSKVMEQRKAAQTATVTQAATQRAQNAASSVKTHPTAPPVAAESTDLRALLERNFSKAQGR